MAGQTFGTDEQFLESWLKFAVFHRVRAALSAATTIDGSDDGFDASQMLVVIQEWVSAHEDFGIWSDAIRRYNHGGSALADCMDRADLKWNTFFPSLDDTTPEKYAETFGLRPPGAINQQYDEALLAWSGAAAAIARNLSRQTQNGRPVFYRLLNKIKHGLAVTAIRTRDGERQLLFYPEADAPLPRDLWAQKVTAERAEFFVRETFAVSRLTAATMDAWFGLTFGREATVPWRSSPDEPGNRTMEMIRSYVEINTLDGEEWTAETATNPE